jgi:hypothetical protein
LAAKAPGLACSVALVLLMLASRSAFAGYPEAMAQAAALEGEGRYLDAISLLLDLREQFPQDYRLELYLGWLAFQSEDYPMSERHYKLARELSAGSSEALLGLGWTALRAGEPSRARRHFRRVLRRDPGNSSAKEGLALAPPSFNLRVSLGASLHNYIDHPVKKSAHGPSARLALGYSNFLLGVTIGSTTFEGPPLSLPEPYFDPNDRFTFSQSEVFVSFGYVFRGFTIQANGVAANDGSPAEIDAQGFGLLGMYSPFGDVRLEVSSVRFRDIAADVQTLEVSWVSPAWRGLGFIPAAVVQKIPEETYVAGAFSIEYTYRPVSFLLGGRVGERF